MAVVIRMKRTGRKNRPCYRISVADSRFPRDGRTIETLGLYDPVSPDPEARVTLNVERAKHWIEVGAQPSETVRSIFARHDVFEGRTRKQRSRAGRRRPTKAKERRAQRKERMQARRAERKATAAAS